MLFYGLALIWPLAAGVVLSQLGTSVGPALSTLLLVLVMPATGGSGPTGRPCQGWGRQDMKSLMVGMASAGGAVPWGELPISRIDGSS